LRAVLTAAGTPDAMLRGATNEEAVGASEVVVLTVPFEAHAATVEGLAGLLAGKVVVDTVVPLRFERGPRPVDVAEGSAAEQAARLAPDARVVAAFHSIAAESLLDPSHTLDEDVLVAGDHAEAKALVSGLARDIRSLRAVDAGPLRFARFLEGLTVLLIGINGRYKTRSGIHVQGLPE
jgi:NADPH-dependent F420 reductase